MDPQPTMPWGAISISLLIGIVLGGAPGFYIGLMQGKTSALEEAQQEQAMLDMQQQAAMQAEVPAENPLQDADPNPIDSVKTNPFE